VGHPASDKRFILHRDRALGDTANAGGLGAVLMQEGDDGNNRVIAYASRQLKGLFTDHKPMEKLGTMHKRTLNRLQVLMMEYDFTMLYQQGCDKAQRCQGVPD
jgi:hypothetical protein